MSFLDKMKDKLGGAISNTPLVKATMLGPRAVGKTSVMASIFSDTKEEIAGTKLYFRPQASCAGALIAKKLQLMDIINKRENIQDKPKAGAIEATNVVTSFDFEMGMKGREKTIDISIKDFPGEYLDSQQEEVSKYIAESHIVMIAIDTPYLMESDGIYNEEKNEVDRVVSFFKNHTDSLINKFILLVPLKCERYFHDMTIEDVSTKISVAYNELISFCRENNVACAITPIQTLGGVEFDKFIDNSNALSKLSKLSSYRFYGNKPEYQPMFCVQPLYYLLTYVANFYEWNKAQQKGIFDRLKDSMTSFLKDDDEFLYEIKKLSMKATVDKFGYRIVNTNTILNIK